MTKKLSVEVKDTRANLRMGKEAIREINDHAEKLINPQAGQQDSNTPLQFGDHREVVLKHDLKGLAEIHNGDYGDDFKCLFYRQLNTMAQRVLRDSLRASMAVQEKPEDDVLLNTLSQEDLNEMFGFENASLFTLEQAAHWVMLTHCVGHAATMVTTADENGFKTKPCQWMAPHFRTVTQMLYGDMQYSIEQSVGSQTAELMKLDMPENEIAEGLGKYEAAQKAQAQERFLTKMSVVSPAYDRQYYKDLGTDEELADLEDMISTLGLNVPALMQDVAQAYKDSKRKSARAGKFIGDIDERIVDLVPRDAVAARREAIAQAKAPEAVTGEQAMREAHCEAINEDLKVTAVRDGKYHSNRPENKDKVLRRVKKEDAQRMTLQ